MASVSTTTAAVSQAAHSFSVHNFIPRFLVLFAFIAAPVLRSAPDEWSWAGAGNTLQVDAKSGGRIVEWSVGGKKLVDVADETGPLSLVSGDGRVFSFKLEKSQVTASNRFQVDGKLSEGTSMIPVSISYEVRKGGAELAVRIEPGSAPADLQISEFGWSFPLSLHPRKRSYFLGDHGLVWDTRYFYQTILDPGDNWKIMKEPDRNEWRYFGLDQLGKESVRLWKSESERTAALIMYQGRKAAPLAQLYDERGGVTLEYPKLAEQAPGALRVDAGGSGKLTVQFWPSSTRPGLASDVMRSAREFTLEAHVTEAAVLAFQKATEEKYAGVLSPIPDPEGALKEADWIVKAPVSSGGPLQVSGGYPFTRGEVRAVDKILVSVSGKAVPVQAKILAYWPDRSIKWALLTFPADVSRAVTDCEPPRVSLRDGRFLPVAVSTNGPAVVRPTELTVVQSSPEEVTISNGDLKVGLGTGVKWLRALSRDGQSLLDPKSAGARAYSDYLYDPKAAFPFDQSLPGGEADRGVLKVDKIEVEQSGPLRAVVRLEGLTTNREPGRIVMRLEFQAGRPEIRITHTAVMRFNDPRRTFMTGMGLELPLASGLLKHVDAGGVTLTPDNGVMISRIQETAGSARVETVKAAGVPAVRSEAVVGPGVLTSSGSAGGVTAVLRNARQLAPNALVADLAGGRLRVEFWPEAAAPMDMRRYSEHLQFGQLESAATETPGTWVNEKYYAEQPVYGLSRTHEVLLDFSSVNKPEAVQALAADFESGPLLYAGWDRYTATEVVLPSSTSEKSPRAWDASTRLTQFFLFHQQLYGWYGFWNFGDFRHRMGGFGGIVPPEILKEMPKTGQIANRIWDNIPSNDWGYDNGTYGWTNTEGLPGLFLSTEYLRHGNRAVFFASEAMSRYERDVIVRQEGRWLGRGTRHGVQPWSDGNHEERQTAATEYRYQYLLTGDGRTRDVIENLYRNVYLKGNVDRHASHSGRMAGLMFHWELTGSPIEAERVKNYMSQFVSDEGVYVSPSVRFPEATRSGEPKGLNSGSQFFHTFGAMHALIEYYELSGDAAVEAAVIKMADAVIASEVIERGRLGMGEYSWAPVAFAALHAKDPAPYLEFLTRYIKADGWRSAYQPVTINPQHWTGDTALMTRTVALSLFWANWSPYVSLAIGDEIWTPEIEKAFKVYEITGRGVFRRRASWQSQFDGIPEIDAYLGPQQPWRTK
jgi:hypothetical protein